MPFVHPVIFWSGLGAVSVPVIIHILNRTRFRMRDWAAMRFLYEAMKRNRRRLQIEELILLALRMLVIVALALALGRLLGCQSLESWQVGGGGPETAVFVVDDSFSMGQRAGEGTLFDAAVNEMTEQIRGMPPGSRVAILRTCAGEDADDPLSELQEIEDPASAAEHLRAMGAAHEVGDLAAALDDAHKMLKGTSGTRRLYVLSDFRRKDLAPPDRAGRLRERLNAIAGEGVDVVMADYGREAEANLTVEQVAPARRRDSAEDIAVVGQPIEVRVVVRNHGRMPSPRTEVTLLARHADEPPRPAAEPQQLAPLEPGDAAAVAFEVKPTRSGPMVLRAKLPEDELELDNQARLVIDVSSAIRLLVVDDRRRQPRPRDRASYSLLAALRPATQDTGFDCDVVSSQELATVDFSEYDAVALLDVASFPASAGESEEDRGEITYPALEALEEFVRGGGGVAIFMGDRVAPGFYNRHMFDGGRGLLPLPIRPRQGDPDDETSYVRFTVQETQAVRTAAPWLRECFFPLGDEIDLTQLVRVHAHIPVDVPETETGAGAAADTVILARFTDPRNSPAIALKPLGKGRVLTFFTSAGREWTDWPATGGDHSYVPVMNKTFQFLARPRDAGRNAPVGTPIEYDVPRRRRRAEAVLTLVSDAREPEQASWREAPEKVSFDDPDRAGTYALAFRLAGRELGTELFSRDVNPAEGDLTPGRQEAIAPLIKGEYLYTERDATADAEALLVEEKTEYWMYALVAMLGLMAVESVLARRFGHYA